MRTLVFLFVSIASAQVTDTIHVDVSVVSVTASVSDRDHRPITNLKREDFTILDNKRPREIQSFWQETDVPLTIGLIADVSGSQIHKIKQHRETISRFLSQVMGPRDRAFIVTVGPYVKLVTDLTSSINELRSGIRWINENQFEGTALGEQCPLVEAKHGLGPHAAGPPKGSYVSSCGTALWEGVYSSARKMKPLTGRKALLVLSDGVDSGSPHRLTDAIEAAQDADTLVYNIRSSSFNILITAIAAQQLARRSMQCLSEETGGRASDLPSKPSALFAQIEADLRSLYVLSFTVPAEDRDEKFHPLEVRTNIPSAIVRARRGYIPKPNF